MQAFEFAARRKRLDIKQRDVEIRMKLPAGSLGGIEDGRIPVLDTFVDELNQVLDHILSERKEEVPAA